MKFQNWDEKITGTARGLNSAGEVSFGLAC